MHKKFYLSLAVLLVFLFLLSATVVFAGAKEKYKGKISPQNIQLNVQSEEQDRLIKGEASYSSLEASQRALSSSYAIYSTNYKASLEEDIANIKGEVNFEVFSKGIAKIPLVRSDNVGLIEVSVNRGTSFVVAEGNKYYLIVNKPGKYRLDLEYLIKVAREREGGPGQFAFEVLPSPISEFEFTINEMQRDVFVEPSIKVETKEEAEKTVAWAIMPMTNNVLVRWTKSLPKETITPVKLEPKVYSTIYTFASVGEGLLRCNTIVNYSILQSEISGVRLALPEDVSVLEVKVPDIRDWKISKEQGRQLLDVYFKYGVKGNYNLDLTYEQSIGEGSVVAQIPLVRPIGVERNKGFIGVASISSVELAVNKLANATEIDAKELPPSIWDRTANPILLAFKYLNDEYDIQLEVTKHEEIPVLVAAVDSANYVTLNTEEGKTLTKAVYQVRNNVKQFLKLTLPDGATLWSVSVSGVPVKPARDKGEHILIPLEKSQLRGEILTQIPVEVVYLEKGSKMGIAGGLKLNLPKADIPTNELYWSVFLPTHFTYYGFGGDIKKVETFKGAGIFGTISAPTPIEKERGERASSTYQQQATYEKKVLDEAGQKGILPIKIDVPEVGKAYRFSKLLVTENEGAYLTAKYISILKSGIARVGLSLAAVIILIAAGVFLMRRK